MITIKIIAGDLKEKNIQMRCECCNCVYELETRNDFKIHWVYKPVKEWCDYKTMIPEYSIVCPNCGYEVYIGLDENDCEDANISQNCFNRIIMDRPDWKSRYKTEVRRVINE